MLNDEHRFSLSVESVFYEVSVREMVDAYRKDREAGVLREDMLHILTAQLLGSGMTPGQLASVAVMAVVMLAELPGNTVE